MTVLRLILRNTFRHRLRLALTAGGIAIVVLAFGLLHTTVTAWYAGVEASVHTRLITRPAASLSIHLPMAYRDRIAAIPGVTGVSYANWFGGVYRDAKDFFPRFAVEPASYLDLRPEFQLSPEAREAFLRDRRGAVVGRKLAGRYGWTVGALVPLQGTIYPGNWEFVVRGIYTGAEPSTDETLMLVHWNHMDERRRLLDLDRAGQVGWYIVRIADATQAAAISEAIDATFANSPAETRTETEQAFQIGFVAMSGAIIDGLQLMAVVLNGITLLVLANAMAMAARERITEYTTMKCLGFQPAHLALLMTGESLAIATLGAGVGVLLTIPAARLYEVFMIDRLGGFFPVFALRPQTLALATAVTVLAGLLASVIPAVKVARIRITAGLRHVG